MRTTLLRVLPLALVAAACSNQTFTVDVPFRVTSVTPSPAAAGVSRQAELVVTFSEEIDAASVANAESFKVEVINGDLTTVVAGAYKYGPVGDAPYAVSFKPNRPFAWLATVRITLTSAIKRQRDGAPLPTPMTFEFRTQAPPPLGITRITPHDGTTGFERTGEVRVTFTEPVDCRAFESTNGTVTFTETRNAHPHWTMPAGATRPVPGTWSCPEMDASDPLAAEGACRSSNAADPVDYCSVTFSWAALAQTDPALAAGLALAPSSRFELNLKGIDVASQLTEVVRSRRAVQRTSDLGVEIHGALAASVNVKGTSAAPPALSVTSARLEQPVPNGEASGRAARLRIGFSERVDCESLDAVTVTEEFDPQVAARRGATQRVVTGTWSCEGELLDPSRHACSLGGCSYVFTPAATGGDVFGFEWSSLIHVGLAGGAHGSVPVVESVRATTAGGQLPDATTFTFAIADPPVFSLVGSSPADGATGVERNSPLVVVFSEPPDCDALAAGTTVTEHRALGGSVGVTGTWACTPAGTETAQDPESAFACPAGGCAATFTPAAAFEASSSVTVALSGGAWQPATPRVASSRATSRAGNLAGPVVIDFRVADPVPYFVTGSTPGDGASGVAAGASLTLRFPRGLNCSSVVPCTGANAATCTLSVEEVADPLVGNTPVDGTGRLTAQVAGSLTCLDGDTELTFIPDAALSPSSEVVVRVAGAAAGPSVRSLDGGYLHAPVTLGYTVADPARLLVVSSLPGTGATGVEADTDIKVTFSHALDCDTVDATSVRAEVAGDEAGPFSPLAGIPGCSGNTVTFTPTAALASSSVVRLLVGTNDVTTTVRTTLATTRGGHLAGPSTLQFQVADPSLFYVTTTTPADGASGVDASTGLTLRFSNALRCASVIPCNGTNASTCTLSVTRVADALAGGGSALVPGTVTCGTSEFTFTPGSAFPASAEVVVRLEGSEAGPAVEASTTEGGRLLSDFQYAFTVADPPALVVVATTPSGSATGITATAPISITFSDDLNCATVTATSVMVQSASPARPNGTPEGSFVTLAGTLGCAGTTDTLTFTPTVPPAASSRVRVSVGTTNVATTVRAIGATSRGGFLAGPVQFEYRVADPKPLSLVATRPVDDPTNRVFASTDVQFTFDRPVTCTTATSRVSLHNATSDTSVNGTVTCVGAEVKFTPTNPLTVGHSYTALAGVGIAATDATTVASVVHGQLPQAVSFLFEVGAEPLSLKAHTPSDAATNVLVGSGLSLTFSQEVAPSSIVPCTGNGVPSGCNLSVNRGTSFIGTTIITTVQGTHGAQTLNYDLADGASAPNLAQSQTYFVRLRGGAAGPLGLNGLSRLPTEHTFTFTTAADATVVSTTPAHGATLVATTSDVCLEFSQNVNAASLTAGGTNQITVSWADSTGYRALVPLEPVPYSVNGRQVCLNIAEGPIPGVDGNRRLLHATEYTVNVSSQVVVGTVALTAPYTFTFETALPPALSGVSIANAVINEALTDGLGDVPVNVRFIIRFAETMDPATLTTTNLVLTGEVAIAPTSLQFDDAAAPRTVTLTPTLPLDHKHQYTLTLQGGVDGLTTLAGEPLHNDVAFPFSSSPPTSLTLAPSNASLAEGVTIAFLSTRALEPSSVTPASVYGRYDGTPINGLVGMSERRRDTVLFAPQPALMPGQIAKYAFGVTDALLDERGNPVQAFERSAVSTNMNLPAPPVALSCELGTCAVAPATGTMPNGPPSWTLTFTDAALAQRILPTTVFGSTSTTEGSISLVAAGGSLGCPMAGTLVPLDVAFQAGTTNGDEVTITPTSPWMKAGCSYSLRVDQTRIANVYNLTAATVGCNGTTGGDTIPTDVLSEAKCAVGNPSPGLLFLAESTAPTLTALEAHANTGSFKSLNGANDIAAYSEIKAVVSEPIDPATVTGATFSISPGVTGTYRFAGNEIRFVPSAPLQTDITYTVKLEGLKDLAGNSLATTTRTFSVENAAGSLTTVFPRPASARGRPFGDVILTFSERIRVSTLVEDTFSGASVVVPGSVSLSDAAGPLPGQFVMDSYYPEYALFIPARPTSGTVRATVRAPSTLRDLAGTPITPGTVP